MFFSGMELFSLDGDRVGMSGIREIGLEIQGLTLFHLDGCGSRVQIIGCSGTFLLIVPVVRVLGGNIKEFGMSLVGFYDDVIDRVA